MYHETSACRLCGNTELVDVLDLGMQAVNDVFPTAKIQRVAAAPLRLVKCTGDEAVCGLLQLAHTHLACEPADRTACLFNSAQLWSSVRHDRHLRKVLDGLLSERAVMAETGTGDSAERSESRAGSRYDQTMRSPRQDGRAILTSTTVLSSQERPLELLAAVREALGRRAVWITQERYMPYMLQRNSYDSICHQNVAYYALKQIRWMTGKAGLKIIGIELDPAGAGTFAIALASRESAFENSPEVESVLDEEAREGLHTFYPYECFAQRVTSGIASLRAFLDKARSSGKAVCALGASKSGNVILQCCNATEADVNTIGEIDSGKVGAFTPGTLLPIVLEGEVLKSKPNFLLVLPWYLRETFLAKSRLAGCNLVFPLPRLEVVRVGP